MNILLTNTIDGLIHDRNRMIDRANASLIKKDILTTKISTIEADMLTRLTGQDLTDFVKKMADVQTEYEAKSN